MATNSKLHRRLMRQLCEAIREFELVSPKDHILLGLSGGKDSLALLDLLGEFMVHHNRTFRVTAVHVRVAGVDYLSDPSYLENQAKQWGIDFRLETIDMEPDRNAKRSPCFLCSWHRRKVLFRLAQELGCNKIALGHHQDDILRTSLMNLAFNGTFSTMPAKLAMRKFPITIIRPLARMKEDDLRLFAADNTYEPVKKSCPFDGKSNRTNIGNVMDEFNRLTPEFRSNLWHALKKVNALIQVEEDRKSSTDN